MKTLLASHRDALKKLADAENEMVRAKEREAAKRWKQEEKDLSDGRSKREGSSKPVDARG